MFYGLFSNLFMTSGNILNKLVNCFNDIMLQLSSSWTFISSCYRKSPYLSKCSITHTHHMLDCHNHLSFR
jgi:hypothetical protein